MINIPRPSTKIKKGEICFADGKSLNEYCNSVCKESCGEKTNWCIENIPDCNCVVSNLYCAMIRIAELEHNLRI